MAANPERTMATNKTKSFPKKHTIRNEFEPVTVLKSTNDYTDFLVPHQIVKKSKPLPEKQRKTKKPDKTLAETAPKPTKAETAKKPKLPPVMRNASVETKYRREMQRMINEMQKDALKRIEEIYAKPLAGEALNVELNRAIDAMSMQWERRFDREAGRIAARFLREIDHHAKAVLLQHFKTISEDFRARRVTEVSEVLQKAIEMNVKLIKSIPVEFHKRIRAIATTTLSHGRDLHFLQKEILATTDISKRRAALIARDQANKITNELAIQRSMAVGITRGIWQHVPGKYSSRKTHLKMDGQEFDLAQGLHDSDVGHFVKPGELVACNCRFMVIIPGIE